MKAISPSLCTIILSQTYNMPMLLAETELHGTWQKCRCISNANVLDDNSIKMHTMRKKTGPSKMWTARYVKSFLPYTWTNFM